MNQILQMKDKNLGNKSKILKTVILPMLLVIAIVSIICVLFWFLGGGEFINKLINGEIIFGQPQKVTSTITFNQKDEKVVMEVHNEVGISKIIYSINNGSKQILGLSGEKAIIKDIKLDVGENVISVTVTDIDGNSTEKEETFVVEAIKPIVELSVIGNSIKITITSETDLSEIKYKWNENSEKIENINTYENRKLFEKQLEIPIGQNILTVIATDIDGNKTEKVQEIKGVTKAVTATYVSGEYLHFTVTGKENIEKVEFQFNGQRFLMNVETFGETKIVHYKVKLVEGKNYLTVTSTTQSGGVDTKSFEQEYTK